MTKPFHKSKINIKEALTLIVGLLVTFRVIPQEYQQTVLEIVVTVSPIMGMVFRTWFTDTSITWESEK